MEGMAPLRARPTRLPVADWAGSASMAARRFSWMASASSTSPSRRAMNSARAVSPAFSAAWMSNRISLDQKSFWYGSHGMGGISTQLSRPG